MNYYAIYSIEPFWSTNMISALNNKLTKKKKHEILLLLLLLLLLFS